MRIKVLVEKKSFKQSSSLPHSSADAHSLLNTAQLCSRKRDRNDGDVQVKVQKSVYFVHNFNKLQLGKAVSCVDIGNIVKNSHL